MAFDKNQFDDIIQEFTVNGEQLHEIAADFRYDLVKGLENPKESSLRMLKSYVGLPTGKETGEYLALDFGGTNVRVLRIRLEGEGKFEITIYTACCNADKGIYYYTTYNNHQITAIDMHKENLDGVNLIHYPLIQGEQIKMQN